MGHLISSLTKEGDNASVNSTCAQPPSPPPPQATAGHLPAMSVPGVGYCKFCTARGPGIYQRQDHSQAFDTHPVSYHNITTQKVLLEKKQISSSVKDRNKLKRVVKACSWFYACISSLLIKPELHSENWSYQRESTFFVIESYFCLLLFKEHPFIFIKLFITYNFTALY